MHLLNAKCYKQPGISASQMKDTTSFETMENTREKHCNSKKIISILDFVHAIYI